MSKKKRREAAQKKAKKKKIAILSIIGACALAAIAIIIIINATQPEARVFAVAGQSVTLYDNGDFAASLAHGTRLSGTYTEDGNTIVFLYREFVFEGRVADDVLSIPFEWVPGCEHWHEAEFPLQG